MKIDVGKSARMTAISSGYPLCYPFSHLHFIFTTNPLKPSIYFTVTVYCYRISNAGIYLWQFAMRSKVIQINCQVKRTIHLLEHNWIIDSNGIFLHIVMIAMTLTALWQRWKRNDDDLTYNIYIFIYFVYLLFIYNISSY